MLRVPKTTVRRADSLGGLSRTQLTTILGAVIYYRESVQSKSAKGKGIWSEVQRKPGASFQGSLPVESHKPAFIPPATRCDNMRAMLPTRQAH